MKKILIFASVLLLLPVCVASAQIASPVRFSMNTSFAAGNATFPAGSYEIRPTDDQGVFEIRSEDGRHGALVEVEPLDTDTPFKQTELVFNKYGNNMVLKEVTVAGGTTGINILTSHLERRHRKAFGKPTRVRHPAKKK